MSSSPPHASAPLLAAEERRVQLGLGHAFAEPKHLLQALTHRSYVNERKHLSPEDNETFEFLGDSIVGLAAAKLLREEFPSAREGELTRKRADLVCERTLAKLADQLDIGAALRLGRGEERSGGRTKARLLASSFEACIAAVMLDAGVEAALETAARLLAPHIDALEPGAEDFKSRIQEHLQAVGRQTPRYEIVGHEGPEHARTFFVTILNDEGELARGAGRNRNEAEQCAAKTALIQFLPQLSHEGAERDQMEEPAGFPRGKERP